MLSLTLRQLAPVIVGTVLAVLWWLVQRRGTPRLPRLVAGLTLTAGLVGLLVESALRLIGPLALNFDVPDAIVKLHADFRFIAPLAAGLIGLGLLALPWRHRRGSGVADLAPRGLFSFARGGWVTAVAALTALVLVVTVAAGAASEPDPATGHYSYYVIDLGNDTSMGTTIYGWYYSLPALIAIAALLTLAASNMILIARPPLDTTRSADTSIRAVRTRNALAVTTGALMLHLAAVLGSLAGTASLHASIPTELEATKFWTPMASLVPWFQALAIIAATIGVTLWASVGLSAFSTRTTTAP